MATYSYHVNLARPQFRLVLQEGKPVPADIDPADWARKEIRPEDRVNADVLKDIRSKGYGVYKLHIDFAELARSMGEGKPQ